MKRNTILFIVMVLLVSAVVWAQTDPPLNCSVATYQITNIAGTSKAGCIGVWGYTPQGFEYYQTLTIHTMGYQTQTGVVYAQANLPLTQIGHCWYNGKDCNPLYSYSKTTPYTATGSNYDTIQFQSLDGFGGSGIPYPCTVVYGAHQFWQCLAVACKASGTARIPTDPCKPKVAKTISPTTDWLNRLFPFSWTTSATICTDSPIVVDVSGKGFFLTDVKNGVSFDIEGTGEMKQMGWTERGAENAFLALPGQDGLVHNGKQLFGNYTPQPQSDHPNGFEALRVYDANSDGVIDKKDAIFGALRLWVDENHDGVSQPGELHTLPEMGVVSISLQYHWDAWHDQWGNQFRYRAKIQDATKEKSAFDVFFVSE